LYNSVSVDRSIERWYPPFKRDTSFLVLDRVRLLIAEGKTHTVFGNGPRDQPHEQSERTDANADAPLRDVKSIIGVYTQSCRTESHQNDLENKDACDYDDEDDIICDAFERIQLNHSYMYLVVEFPWVDEIEQLHHHESVKDECEVSRVGVVLLEAIVVVVATSYKVKPSTADCSTNDTIVVLGGEIATDDSVKRVRTLGYPQLTAEYESYHNYELKDGLANDVFEHLFWDNVLVTTVRLSVEQLLARWLGG
jgi:hypothetical protein